MKRRLLMGFVLVMFSALLVSVVGAVEISDAGVKAHSLKDTALISSHIQEGHEGSGMQNASHMKHRTKRQIKVDRNVRRKLGPAGVLLSPQDIKKIRRKDGSIDRDKLKELVKRRMNRVREMEERIKKIRQVRKMREERYKRLLVRYEKIAKKGIVKHKALESNLRRMRMEYRECVLNKKEEINGKNCSEIVDNYTLMAKNYLYNSISVAMSKLEQIRARLKESKILNETIIERREKKINDTIERLKEFQEMINKSESLEELKQVALNYSRYMLQVRARAYKAVEIERIERFKFVIERARVLEARMRVALEKAKLSDEEKQQIEDIIDEFSQHIAMAEQYREEALRPLQNADEEHFEDVARKVNREYLSKMRDELKEAHRILQGIWNKYIAKRKNMKEVVMGRRPLNQVNM